MRERFVDELSERRICFNMEVVSRGEERERANRALRRERER